MDQLSRLGLEMLVEGAQALRAALEAGNIPQGDDAPIAMQEGRCAAMGSALAKAKIDPPVRRVWASFDPDERGLLEVLYVTPALEPHTAYVKGVEVAYVAEGW